MRDCSNPNLSLPSMKLEIFRSFRFRVCDLFSQSSVQRWTKTPFFALIIRPAWVLYNIAEAPKLAPSQTQEGNAIAHAYTCQVRSCRN